MEGEAGTKGGLCVESPLGSKPGGGIGVGEVGPRDGDPKPYPVELPRRPKSIKRLSSPVAADTPGGCNAAAAEGGSSAGDASGPAEPKNGDDSCISAELLGGPLGASDACVGSPGTAGTSVGGSVGGARGGALGDAPDRAASGVAACGDCGGTVVAPTCVPCAGEKLFGQS